MSDPISLSAVAELPDDTWIDGGFFAVVDSIEDKKTGPTSKRPNSKFWVVNLSSQTGPETAEWSLFTFPKFAAGDLIEVTGKGIKRKVDSYNGGIKIQAGDKAIITVRGQSAHHAEQVERKATGAPSVSGAPQHVPGQTVGMALKEAIALRARFAADNETLIAWLQQPEFWAAVHETASDVIRVSRMLEAGKLAPSPKERANPSQPQPAANSRAPMPAGGGRADPPKSQTKPLPGPGGNVAQDELSEDVPF